jgi:hypothetical protein
MFFDIIEINANVANDLQFLIYIYLLLGYLFIFIGPYNIIMNILTVCLIYTIVGVFIFGMSI